MCSKLIKEITISKRSFVILNRDKPFQLSILYDRRKPKSDKLNPWSVFWWGEWALIPLLFPFNEITKTRTMNVSLEEGSNIINSIKAGEMCLKCNVQKLCTKFPLKYYTENNTDSVNILNLNLDMNKKIIPINIGKGVYIKDKDV